MISNVQENIGKCITDHTKARRWGLWEQRDGRETRSCAARCELKKMKRKMRVVCFLAEAVQFHTTCDMEESGWLLCQTDLCVN